MDKRGFYFLFCETVLTEFIFIFVNKRNNVRSKKGAGDIVSYKFIVADTYRDNCLHAGDFI